MIINRNRADIDIANRYQSQRRAALGWRVTACNG